jgi:hypothetical protein
MAEFPQAEYEKLVNSIYRPVFLQKLARDWGYVPQDEAEVQSLLEDAEILRRVHEEEKQKQASANNSIRAEASNRLKQAAAERGYPRVAASREHLIAKAASDVVSGNPEIAAAALKFSAYAGR